MKKIFYSLTITIFLLLGCENTTEFSNPFEYSVEQKMSCFCPQAGEWIKLYVQADTIAKAIKMSNNSELTYTQRKPYKSIKGLWDLISQIDTSTYELKVEIDSANNYPSYIFCSPNKIQQGDTVMIIQDANFSYTTRNYTRLN